VPLSGQTLPRQVALGVPPGEALGAELRDRPRRRPRVVTPRKGLFLSLSPPSAGGGLSAPFPAPLIG